MIGCLRTRVRKQPIIALYFEFENELKLYNLEAMCLTIITNGVFNGEQEIENTGECLLISSLPHKALRTIIDIARLAEI